MFVDSSSDTAGSRAQFLSKAAEARQQRAFQKHQTDAAILIQANYRGHLTRQRIHANLRNEFDESFSAFQELDRKIPLLLSVDALKQINRLLFVYNHVKDKHRFLCLTRYLLLSVESTDVKHNFAALAISKDYILIWARVMKKILLRNCKCLDELKPDLPADSKLLHMHLHMLLSFTSCNTWAYLKTTKQGDALKPSLNQLCNSILADIVSKGFYIHLQNLLRKGLARKEPALKHTTLSAVLSLALRPLVNSNFADDRMTDFITHILSTPALVQRLRTTAQECLALFMSHKIFERSLSLLSTDQNSRAVFDSLAGSYSLCLLANIIQLGAMDKAVLVEQLLDFVNVVTRLFELCRSFVVTKKSSMTFWHPVLGWYSQSLDSGLHDVMSLLVSQLQLLWTSATVKCLFADLVNSIPKTDESQNPDILPTTSTAPELLNSVKSLFKKVLDQRNTPSKATKRLGTPETTIVALVCALYQNALVTLTQLRYDILSGLCYQDFLLPRLWHFISILGPNNGLKPFLELLAVNPKASSPEFQILILFCDAAAYLLTILDDVELYEQQKPFTRKQLIDIAHFLNVFVFKSVWDGLIDAKHAGAHPLFTSLHGLLTLLYCRDSRRTLSNDPAFWLLKEAKSSVFLAELDKGNARAEFLLQKVPHVLGHRDRVLLFRRYVAAEREALGISADSRPSTLITVHRSRIVEDGYRQLSLLHAQAMKGIIRVKFVNEQGLDEAGIDQDGVFKEFLEETVKRVFNPSLNLFKETSEGRLFPSPTSNIHENHLALFDFVGRILAKAVFEGIVVEVPFAMFFLNNLLGRTNSATYSSIDELPSLDPELYKSLTYIKHYEGDVSDLDLTFSSIEDYMGEMVTHELVPGGRTIDVTNENKISYVHLMAHFRMHVQIKDQVNAFVKGFRALLKPEWLNLFAAPELQKLISGDTEDIDLEDLRKHAQYFGGFHNNHKVITWLWDVLEKDFNAEERKLFLRFVTSCSKPPLLGFAYLEPPFSIRCVECTEDQDQGDTLGSVIRGFLAIHKKDPVGRLPTSSTCFNLLKLPNYQKKSTLREKLRYAVRSGTGFELS